MKYLHRIIISFGIMFVAAAGCWFFVFRSHHPTGPATNSAINLQHVVGVSVTTDQVFYVTSSGTKELLADVSNIYAAHVHPAEYHAGDVYVIRRMGDINTNAWTDELWKIKPDKTMMKLYSLPGLDFRVSPDEHWIAITATVGSDTTLKLLNAAGQMVQEYSLDSISDQSSLVGYDFDGWTTEDILWGHTNHADTPRFLAVSADSAKVTTYDFPPHMTGSEETFNLGTDTVAFSTYPMMFDADSAAQFAKAGTAVKLYVYSFVTKQEQLIATGYGRPMNPSWSDNQTLSYTDSSTGQTKTAIVWK